MNVEGLMLGIEVYKRKTFIQYLIQDFIQANVI